jgi:hypothetical protein
LELIADNDDRLQQVMFAAGSLWTAAPTAVRTPQGPVRAGAAWFILTPSIGPGEVSASVLNQGYVAIDSPHQDSVMFPAVGVNAAGKGAISFSVVGEDFFPSAGYALLDAVNGAGPIVISGPGVAPDDGFSGYAPFATRGAARWGDYSAAASDEAGNIWMGAEMIPHIPPVPGILAANWGTFITAVRVAAAACNGLPLSSVCQLSVWNAMNTAVALRYIMPRAAIACASVMSAAMRHFVLDRSSYAFQIVQEITRIEAGLVRHHTAADVHAYRGRDDRPFGGNDTAHGRADAPVDIGHCNNPFEDEWKLRGVEKLLARLVPQRHTLRPGLDRYAFLRRDYVVRGL